MKKMHCFNQRERGCLICLKGNLGEDGKSAMQSHLTLLECIITLAIISIEEKALFESRRKFFAGKG